MRVTLDVTPLIGPRTGVGRYVAALVRELGRASAAAGDDVAGIAFTIRGRRQLPAALPAGTRAVGPPAPARVTNRVWGRVDWPPVGLLTGPTDVFHATNFVLPPPGRAAGVVTVHDLSFLRSPSTVTPAARAYRHLVPLSIRRAAMVLTPSAAVADELRETYALPADRIQVTPLGVDPEWYEATPPDPELRRRLGLPERYFVFVGNLEPRKNLPLLLDAYRDVLAVRPDAPGLLLVGPPGWGPALDLSGLPPGRVVFSGYREDHEVQALVAGASALVYPTGYEGFGLPPLEALACGVPVVASDLPVIREVVGTDPRCATLLPAGDVDALAAALVARSDASAEGPGPAATRQARARLFTWTATATITRAAYARAVSR
ncbi:glycosyltransferase family 1 protein [Modestobacter sp. VKM Ac-2977]|uniref:glycosyltransferase family 4 protein n=1 Tax=Modestobacter sp. VKM Ac-2977 TaxID=3004131 RepID=UPI0022AA1B36|nr:glycosyltransferase family 1 protein [Modestobacter sp. VKM Ac-2977]MCZ2822334.1 glycosyltransferase family 1 protein [Modestobacter sp. VKM Ac-2977]